MLYPLLTNSCVYKPVGHVGNQKLPVNSDEQKVCVQSPICMLKLRHDIVFAYPQGVFVSRLCLSYNCTKTTGLPAITCMLAMSCMFYIFDVAVLQMMLSSHAMHNLHLWPNLVCTICHFRFSPTLKVFWYFFAISNVKMFTFPCCHWQLQNFIGF